MLTTLDRNLEVFLACKEKILNQKLKWKNQVELFFFVEKLLKEF